MKKGVKVFGWAVYDLANTAFSALFVTFFFPVLIKVYLGGNEFQLGLIISLSMLLAGVLVPFIGALSDAFGRRMPFVIIFTLACVIVTALTGYVGLYPALILGLFANLFYHAALDVYDAILVDISHKKNMGLVSGYGVALGYIGTILSLGMAYLLLGKFGWENEAGVRAMFPATAVFFLAFASITFFLVKDKVRKRIVPFSHAIEKAFFELKTTVTQIRKFRNAAIFLLASFIYTDGMNTSILFLYLYGREQIGLGIKEFFIVFAVMALASALGSLLFGKINDHIGSKKTLTLSLIIWVLVIFSLMNIKSYAGFLTAGSMGGVVLGAIWTVNRPMLVKLTPKHKVAEFFGIHGLTEKFSGVIGPVLFGWVVVVSNYQAALWILVFFFLAGLIVLQFVKDNQ